MIVFVTTRGHQYTWRTYLESYGAALGSWIKLATYEDLFQSRELPRGTYVFSDIERLPPRVAEHGARLWQVLHGHGCHVFNHPTRSWRRYELLRNLYERGGNEFNVYKLTECRRPRRFPVFLRTEDEHGGPSTPLLHTPEELNAAIGQLDHLGKSREDALVVEWCDTADENGIYRKYGAFCVAGRVVPRHIFFRKDWAVKGWKLLDEPYLREEQQYLADNPHAEQVREIFATARIDYGRIDYALKDGKLQVWEINTNPMIMTADRDGGPPREPVQRKFDSLFRAALEELNAMTN